MEGYGLPKKTRLEISGTVRLLGLKRPSDILDVGCGLGRHALGLAALGHRVTGLDWAKEFVKEADAAARRADLPASFVRGDRQEKVSLQGKAPAWRMTFLLSNSRKGVSMLSARPKHRASAPSSFERNLRPASGKGLPPRVPRAIRSIPF